MHLDAVGAIYDAVASDFAKLQANKVILSGGSIGDNNGNALHIAIVGADEDPPTNVSAAGESAIQLSIRGDPARDDAVWLWAAADNLKLSALNAVACAQAGIAGRPKGRIQ